LHYEKFADGTVNCIENEMPFELPNGWEWVNLGTVCDVFGRIGFRGYTKGDFVSKGEGAISLSPSNIVNNSMNYDNCSYITWQKYEESPEIMIYNGDILLVKTGSSYGKSTIVQNLPEKATINPQFVVLKNSRIITSYLCYFLQSPYCISMYEKFVGGTAIPTFSQANLKAMYIAVPPIQEQSRIVSAIRTAEEQIILIGDNNNELQTDINLLKSKILDLAIRGKLVPQDPNDEPASILLERIRAEKDDLIKQGKIKRDKKETIIFKGDDNSYYEKLGNTDVCIDHKLPFTLPDGWTWCVLPEIAEIIMGSSPDGTTINNSNEGIEFHQGKIFFTNKMLNPSDKSTTQPSKIAPKDSVLLCVRAPVGELNITDRSICIGRGLASIHPYHYIDAEWLFYWLQTYKGYLNMKATGSTFVAITADIVKTILMPLPPLKEQEEILKTINKVFFIVALIEKSLM